MVNYYRALLKKMVHPNLIAHYEFENTVTDSVGSLDGTLFGSPSYVVAPNGFGLDLNGVTEGVNLPSNSVMALTAFTLSVYVYLAANHGPQWVTILEHDRGGANWWGLFRKPNSLTLHFRHAAIGFDFIVDYIPETWMHIVITTDNSQAKGYMNTVLDVTNNSPSALVSTSGTTAIGFNNDDAEFYKGTIDDLRVYNKVLDQTEITDLYNYLVSSEVVDIVRRINMGGAAITATDGNIDWQSNSTSGSTSGTGWTLNVGFNTDLSGTTWGRHPSIPTQLPDADFQTLYDSERWDSGGAPEMLLTFTGLTTGTYSVRLYIGEFSAGRATGWRNYDVIINSVQVATLLDAVEEFGNSEVAGMVQFDSITVSADTITVEWIHGAENPQVQGVEIIKT